MNYAYEVCDLLDTEIKVNNVTKEFFGCKHLRLQGLYFYTTVHSDITEDKLVTAFVCITESLWLYVCCGGFGNSVYVFDGRKTGITEKDISKWRGKTSIETLKRLKPFIVSVYKQKDRIWSKVDAKNLHKELPV